MVARGRSPSCRTSFAAWALINSHGVQIDSLISALEEKGLAVLAEPNLISQLAAKGTVLCGRADPDPVRAVGSVGGTTPTVTVNYYPVADSAYQGTIFATAIGTWSPVSTSKF